MIENVTDGEPRTLDPRALIWRGEYYNRNGDAAQHEKDDPDGDGDALHRDNENRDADDDEDAEYRWPSLA